MSSSGYKGNSCLKRDLPIENSGIELHRHKVHPEQLAKIGITLFVHGNTATVPVRKQCYSN
jgi:hypothetical protein